MKEFISLYKCEICYKTFTINRGSKQHEIVHTGKGSHECVKCSKTFATKQTLDLHEIVHEKHPHECEKCTKTCKR